MNTFYTIPYIRNMPSTFHQKVRGIYAVIYFTNEEGQEIPVGIHTTLPRTDEDGPVDIYSDQDFRIKFKPGFEHLEEQVDYVEEWIDSDYEYPKYYCEVCKGEVSSINHRFCQECQTQIDTTDWANDNTESDDDPLHEFYNTYFSCRNAEDFGIDEDGQFYEIN